MASAPAQHEKLKFLDPESLQQFLTFVRDNGWFYKIILRSRHDFPIQEGFDQLYQLLLTPVKKSTPELADDDLMYLFITFQASFTMILRHWSENDYNKTPAQIAQLIINSLPNLIFQAHFGRPAV
ncbi:TetR-like C-terminal domain-containing protein [Loigolactobacillus coryniformis]|uniref:TetR-like C-terminal domain-containing protein n=1 Tax=Loigolactobacillus coryniformis TaxID=1610 RepID=UPI00195FD645|nr:TetR-like C-terminal domain-containing protein [Loigolactobacillus coryniformis]